MLGLAAINVSGDARVDNFIAQLKVVFKMVLLVAMFKPPHTLLFALAVRHVERTPPILQTSFHSCSATG